MSLTDRDLGRAQASGGARLGVVLAALTLLGPAAMDLYLPVLPTLARELAVPTSTAQLTMSMCLLGLAFGQVVAGPLSDRYGRRRPLIVGLVGFVAASLLCAVTDSSATLIVLRLAQGLTAATALVIAQAAGRDVYSGRSLTRYYGRIVVISGLAAIVAPVVGGQLAKVLDWRGFFVVLSVLGAVILVTVMLQFHETLPNGHRTTGGLKQSGGHLRRLLKDRWFFGAMSSSALIAGAYFAYLAAASFVLQDMYGLTPAAYSLVFALNAAGFALAGFLVGRASERWSERLTLRFGIWVALAAGTGMLSTSVLRLPLVAAVICLLGVAVGAAIVSPPATSLAMRDYPQYAGTASAVLGFTRFTAGAITAPAVGVAGSHTMLPVAMVVLACSVLAMACLRRLPRSA